MAPVDDSAGFAVLGRGKGARRHPAPYLVLNKDGAVVASGTVGQVVGDVTALRADSFPWTTDDVIY